MDFREIDFGCIGLGMEEIAGLVMVLSVLIAEFKLRTELFPCRAFSRI